MHKSYLWIIDAVIAEKVLRVALMSVTFVTLPWHNCFYCSVSKSRSKRFILLLLLVWGRVLNMTRIQN